MLHPSYSDLMKVVNSEVEPGEAPVVNSRYSIVMATSKRARQIISGEDPMVDSRGKKQLSVAVEELNQGMIKILSEEEAAKKAEENRIKAEKAAEEEKLKAEKAAEATTETEGETAAEVSEEKGTEEVTETNTEATAEGQPEDC